MVPAEQAALLLRPGEPCGAAGRPLDSLRTTARSPWQVYSGFTAIRTWSSGHRLGRGRHTSPRYPRGSHQLGRPVPSCPGGQTTLPDFLDQCVGETGNRYQTDLGTDPGPARSLPHRLAGNRTRQQTQYTGRRPDSRGGNLGRDRNVGKGKFWSGGLLSRLEFRGDLTKLGSNLEL